MLASIRGHLLAWDPIAQRKVWDVEHPSGWNGGVLSTAGGLVFQGDATGYFSAYEAGTGVKLWSYPVRQGIVAPPITYSVDGEQYVALLSGAGVACTRDSRAKSRGNTAWPAARVAYSRSVWAARRAFRSQCRRARPCSAAESSRRCDDDSGPDAAPISATAGAVTVATPCPAACCPTCGCRRSIEPEMRGARVVRDASLRIAAWLGFGSELSSVEVERPAFVVKRARETSANRSIIDRLGRISSQCDPPYRQHANKDLGAHLESPWFGNLMVSGMNQEVGESGTTFA